jgi:hypothetical protein
VLRLLLDEHIAPAVAVAMRRAEPSVHVESLVEWQDGRYIGLPDDVIIAAACRDGRTLVTYDQVTIVPLIVALAERGDHHGGVVLVSHWAIRQNDVGTLARTLVALWRAQRRHKWADRCVYVRP